MKTCNFHIAWVGKCKAKVVEGTDYCEDHTVGCEVCGAQATDSCDHTGSLVCGAPLCGSVLCKYTHRFTKHCSSGSFNLATLPYLIFDFCQGTAQTSVSAMKQVTGAMRTTLRNEQKFYNQHMPEKAKERAFSYTRWAATIDLLDTLLDKCIDFQLNTGFAFADEIDNMTVKIYRVCITDTARNKAHVFFIRPWLESNVFTFLKGLPSVTHLEIDADEQACIKFFKEGMFVQNAFPTLAPEVREYLITGLLPEEQA